MAKTPKKRPATKLKSEKPNRNSAAKKPVTATRESSLVSRLKRFAAFDREHSEHADWKHPSIYDLVVTHGIQCTSQNLPKGIKRGKQKQCFHNAFELLLDNPDLTYVEGYIQTSGGTLVLHAWVVDAHNRVIDCTLADPESTAYFGIPFDATFVTNFIARTGYHGILCRWPDEEVRGFLSKGLPKRALKKPDVRAKRVDAMD